MSITHLSSVSQLEGILAKSKDKLSVIDFHATWCGPCHAIAPTFEAASKRYTNVNFMKCDVDEVPEIASMYSITAMPTFVFLKGNTKVHVVRGADKAGLEAGIRLFSDKSSTGAFSGKGHTLSDSPPASPSETKGYGLGPQVKVLLALLAAYGIFWYFS